MDKGKEMDSFTIQKTILRVEVYGKMEIKMVKDNMFKGENAIAVF